MEPRRVDSGVYEPPEALVARFKKQNGFPSSSAAFAAAVDRIAKNYSPETEGLTMERLQELLYAPSKRHKKLENNSSMSPGKGSPTLRKNDNAASAANIHSRETRHTKIGGTGVGGKSLSYSESAPSVATSPTREGKHGSGQSNAGSPALSPVRNRNHYNVQCSPPRIVSFPTPVKTREVSPSAGKVEYGTPGPASPSKETEEFALSPSRQNLEHSTSGLIRDSTTGQIVEWNFELDEEPTAATHEGKSQMDNNGANNTLTGAVKRVLERERLFDETDREMQAELIKEEMEMYWQVVNEIATGGGGQSSGPKPLPGTSGSVLGDFKKVSPIAPWNPAWEEAILERLAVTEGERRDWDRLCSTGMTSNDIYGYGQQPVSHLEMEKGPGDLSEHLQTTSLDYKAGFSPSDMVEAMFDEVLEGYEQACRRAMLDYDLSARDRSLHHGLSYKLLEKGRYYPPPLLTRADCNLNYHNVPQAAAHLLTSLRTTEKVLSDVHMLWYKPDKQYYTLQIFDRKNVADNIPMGASSFSKMIETACDSTMTKLSKSWLKDATEVIASFVLELQSFSENTQENNASAEDMMLQVSDPNAGDYYSYLARWKHGLRQSRNESLKGKDRLRRPEPFLFYDNNTPNPEVAMRHERDEYTGPVRASDFPVRGPQALARRLLGIFAGSAVILSNQLKSLIYSNLQGLREFLGHYISHKSPSEFFKGSFVYRIPSYEQVPVDNVDLNDAQLWSTRPINPFNPSVSVALVLEYVRASRPQNPAELNNEENDQATNPRRGECIKKLWCGSVNFVLDPQWDVILNAFKGSIDYLIRSCNSLTRPDAEIDAGQYVKESLSDDQDENAPKETLSGVDQEDEAVRNTHLIVSNFLEQHKPGPEWVRSLFDKYVYLFDKTELERLLELVSEEHPWTTYKSEVKKYINLIENVREAAPDTVHFAAFAVSTVNLKETIIGRIRLLISVVLQELKEVILVKMRTINSKFSEMNQRLQEVPSDSSGLVSLQDYIEESFTLLQNMEKQVYGKNGINVVISHLHCEGTAVEALPSDPAIERAKGNPKETVRSKSKAQDNNYGEEGSDDDNDEGSEEFTPGNDSIAFSRSQAVEFKEVLTWPAKLQEMIDACERVVAKQRSGLVEDLEKRISEFQQNMSKQREAISKLASEGSLSKVSDTVKKIQKLREKLEANLRQARELTAEQKRLDIEVTEFTDDVETSLEELAPYEKLWTTVERFQDYYNRCYNSPVSQQVPDEIRNEGDTLRSSIIKIMKELPQNAESASFVGSKIRKDVEQFLNHDFQVVELLANPGIESRHWDEMEERTSLTLPREPSSSLQDFLRTGIQNHVSEIEDICVSASKEYSLSNSLSKMKEEWEGVQLDMAPHKDTGAHILTSAAVEQVQMLLDDHSVKATTMLASRYAKPLEEDIKSWTEKLNLVQNTLDEWLTCQGQWLYLQPIFSSEDIMRQMPKEGKMFEQVDKLWRQASSNTVSNPDALSSFGTQTTLEKLQEANSMLDDITKGLNEYLETKRLYFPRFFFLSNDELLEILAETKDPLRVQKHLKKAFEGIHQLEFENKSGKPEDLQINAMISPEGEKVELSPEKDGRMIHPHESRGNVEEWLVLVEAAMRRSVARSIDDSVRAFEKAEKRSHWATEWPGQVILAVSKMFWTYEVEQVLTGKRNMTVQEYVEECDQRLQDIILLIRGELSKLQRQTLSALVVLDVHSRDVTEYLANSNVTSPYAFEWNSQLRYYWNEKGESAKTGKPESVSMRMINAEVLYANEYLGNSSRLVITPLTDRCYRTLIGAVHLNLGGAPEGPAGTGKTETVKDLAKAAGMMCIVYNCSDQLDFKAMAKFFKGLASSGAWSCFDEFNRIELEVLSVVAQQILSIQLAKQAGQDHFSFEGTEISLRPTASVFITMNPGYAGRSELPDNLKALFRSVAMMVPDYSLIARIILYSNGYLDAEPMARKIVATYKLCSEQLSSQDHYDYGMRAVIAVLRAAGNLKRKPENASAPEDELILRAILDVNQPKFLSMDIPLFNGIVKDLFPHTENKPPDRKMLSAALVQAAAQLRLVPDPYLMNKCVELYEMMLVRHGFMLVGMPWAGKTACVQVLRLALSWLLEKYPDDSRWAAMDYTTIFPKSIPLGQLYGQNDPVTQEWTDGVLSNEFRRFASIEADSPEASRLKWLIFDGPVDAIWIENMNTVLDDNKKLCLMSGEIIAMSGKMSMVFETQDLAAASPATVSRCGMIYLEPTEVGWRPLVVSWLDRLCFPDMFETSNQNVFTKCTPYTEFMAPIHANADRETQPIVDADARVVLENLFELFMDPCLVWLKKSASQYQYLPLQEQTIVNNMIKLIQCCLFDASANRKKEDFNGLDAAEIDATDFSEQEISNIFIFSLIWAVGGCLNQKGRQRFDEFVRKIAENPGSLGASAYIGIFETRGWRGSQENHRKAAEVHRQERQRRSKMLAAAGDEETSLPLSSGISEADRNALSIEDDYVAPTDSIHRFATDFKLSESKPKVSLPNDSILYDFFFSKGQWKKWSDVLPSSSQMAERQTLIVPTSVTVQFNSFMQLFLDHKQSVLVCGPTGTGKTDYMKKLLDSQPAEQAMSTLISFSARSSSNLTQSIIDGKLDRRRKGVFGPPIGKTNLIFVDDLNLPEPEQYGAQPPLELLRQLMENGGWYDISTKDFRSNVDCQLFASMGPPGGGRNEAPPRLLRKVFPFCVPEFDESTMRRIFETIVDSFLRKNNFEPAVAKLGPTVVEATQRIYASALNQLRPTPAKSHYTFNLRDFSRIINGVMLCSPQSLDTPTKFALLWAHEVSRVIGDRLVSAEDKDWFASEVFEVSNNNFKEDLNQHCKRFVDSEAGDSVSTSRLLNSVKFSYITSKKELYSLVEEPQTFIDAVNTGLSDYNEQSRSPMDVVLFSYFLEHVSRLLRVLRLSGGHALLVGLGGSGRQTTCKLSAHLAEATMMSIELTKGYSEDDWKDDLKRILRKAGTQPDKVMFFFSDNQIKWEGMIEDVSNILNTGEVPNLFSLEDRAEILDEVQSIARNEGLTPDWTAGEWWNYFLQRMKERLHVVVSMSPVGDAFRDRLRKFPSLISCCNIDWYGEWPREALYAVAKNSLKTVTVESKEDDGEEDAEETKDENVTDERSVLCEQLSELSTFLHISSYNLALRFHQMTERHCYITPTSFLELLNQFQTSLHLKQSEVGQEIRRYTRGLEQLGLAETSVNSLRKELEELQPTLAKSQEETQSLMQQIEERLPEVEEVRATVKKETEEANEEAAQVQSQKDECEADLAEAMPILESALKALNTLTNDDIKLVKSFSNPPNGVRVTMAAVCVMLGEKPDKIQDPEGGVKKVDDYWGPAKRLLNDSKFLDRLTNYDKDNIDPKIIAKIRKTYIPDPEFDPDRVAKAAKAAAGMASWVHAMDKYERVAKEVAPKREALKKAEAQLNEKMSALETKQAELKKVEDQVNDLQEQLDGANKRKAELEEEVDNTQKKLNRAEQLIEGLGGEKVRWKQRAEELRVTYKNLIGDVMLASATIAYLGPFTLEFRGKAIREWSEKCIQLGLPSSFSEGENSREFSLASVLGDPVKVRQWHIDGLPTDSFSTDNAVIVSNARRWPLMIDPQGQANKWIKKMERDSNLKIIKLTDKNFLRTLENSVQVGVPVLLENVDEKLDPALDPLLLKNTFKQGGVTCIRIGDSNVDYDANFRLYITTKLRNPHYTPEVATKVSLLNFTITPAGLQDQLINTVVAEERPDLHEQKNELIVQSAENEKQLRDLESNILEVLSREGNILEDEDAINALNSSKTLSEEIMEKQEVAKRTEKEIDETRAAYEPVAVHASTLFFAIADLGVLDPMYQYSMVWFSNLFINSIRNSKKTDRIDTRVKALNDHFTSSLYDQVCRSLFEKHKLVFSVILCIRLLRMRGELPTHLWSFLLTGGVGMDNPHPNPAPEWLSDNSWNEICRLADFEAFNGLIEDVKKNVGKWYTYFSSKDYASSNPPEPWSSKTELEQILLLRCLRPDMLVDALKSFIKKNLGEQFLHPPSFDLQKSYDNSSAGQPLLFLLSPGADPMASLLSFAAQMKTKVETISLGQGQGPKAEHMMKKALEKGEWVVLQNCHLAASWMPRLEKLCEQLADPGEDSELPPAHPKFRLWCTSYPTPVFPLSVLQNGVKITSDPPVGMRANLQRSYLSDPIADKDFFDKVSNATTFRRMLFSLCFFHAVVQERRQFGPLGWNIPYEFNESDLRISINQLAMFLDDDRYTSIPKDKTQVSDEIPFDTLRYLTGECNYGGRVTDDKDRRCLLAILRKFYCQEALQAHYQYTESEDWLSPPADVTTHEGYVDYIQSLPDSTSPAVFGLHSNAIIVRDQHFAFGIIGDTLECDKGALNDVSGGDEDSEEGSSGGESKETKVKTVVSDILGKLHSEYDVENVSTKFPIEWANSLNTVLVQELERYNRLLNIIRTSLEDLQKALDGRIVMSAQLERVMDEVLVGHVPSLWMSRSYPSRKPLAGYIADLGDRTAFLDKWIDEGSPPCFWLPGFFFTQSFLTAVLQNYARKYTVAIDDLDFDVRMLHPSTDVTQSPQDGVYIHGLYLDGCSWNDEKHILDESAPNILFASAPNMWLNPCRRSELPEFQHYNCPVYRTDERRGTLSTTGHSTNFVMFVRMPSDKPEDHWILRGVALLLSLAS